MRKRRKKKSGFLNRLKTHYRIVFIDDESLEEVASARLSLRRLYAILSMLFVIVAIISVLLIVLTPLKYYLPGYGSSKDHRELVQMKRTVDSLHEVVVLQQQYQENIRQVISGDFKGVKDTARLDMDIVKKEAINNIFPQAEEIKKDAIKKVDKENREKEKATGEQ